LTAASYCSYRQDVLEGGFDNGAELLLLFGIGAEFDRQMLDHTVGTCFVESRVESAGLARSAAPEACSATITSARSIIYRQ
jgi:hypothetical protein